MILQEGNWEKLVLPFADDIMLISNSKENLFDLVLEFERAFKEKELTVNPV